MTAPSLAAYFNGQNQVSADNLNTFMQTCDVVSDLRGFGGILGIEVYLRGFSAIGDGGQGQFYWNPNSRAPDDGGFTTIVPNGSTAGAWTRISSAVVSAYSIVVPVNGFAFTIAAGINQLILNPVSALATGTITMPPQALDGQPLRITAEKTITLITFAPSTGQTIVNAPTTLAQATSAQFMYSLPTKTWYRV